MELDCIVFAWIALLLWLQYPYQERITVSILPCNVILWMGHTWWQSLLDVTLAECHPYILWLRHSVVDCFVGAGRSFSCCGRQHCYHSVPDGAYRSPFRSVLHSTFEILQTAFCFQLHLHFFNSHFCWDRSSCLDLVVGCSWPWSWFNLWPGAAAEDFRDAVLLSYDFLTESIIPVSLPLVFLC